jgi:hypothetical protein
VALVAEIRLSVVVAAAATFVVEKCHGHVGPARADAPHRALRVAAERVDQLPGWTCTPQVSSVRGVHTEFRERFPKESLNSDSLRESGEASKGVKTPLTPLPAGPWAEPASTMMPSSKASSTVVSPRQTATRCPIKRTWSTNPVITASSMNTSFRDTWRLMVFFHPPCNGSQLSRSSENICG